MGSSPMEKDSSLWLYKLNGACSLAYVGYDQIFSIKLQREMSMESNLVKNGLNLQTIVISGSNPDDTLVGNVCEFLPHPLVV